MSDMRIAATSAGSTIYDLGYRHYEGKRRGRLYAAWSLYVESLRMVWGFGRPLRSKAAPFILAGLYAIGAVWQIAVLAFAQTIVQQSPEQLDQLKFANYFPSFSFFLILFCVAQAPELLARDQRHHVLPLYFTREITRVDYALARLLALATSLFVALLLPLAGLFGGHAFLAQDVITGFTEQFPKVVPSILSSGVIAITMAALSLMLCAFSPRRAYCAVSLVAYFLLVENVPTVIFQIGKESNWEWTKTLLLVRPMAALNGANDFLFGVARTFFDRENDPVSLDAYLVAAVLMAVATAAVLLWRYRRIPA